MPAFAQLWEKHNRTRIFLISASMLLVIALVDWKTKPYVSLGFLYLFPIMLTAGFAPRWAIVTLGGLCAVLSESFSSLEPSWIRLGFETLALAGCGLFLGEVVRNRRLTWESQERLRVLIETSPAAIITLDQRGFVELANSAATELIAPLDGHLVGLPIGPFLPELHRVLRREEGPQFRTSMQCQGHRGDGESFLANVWFSTYKEGSTPKLAAIIADITEERSTAPAENQRSDHQGRSPLSSRELDVLRLLVQGLSNKEIASRLEVSESTVKNTFQQLFAKTCVRTRSQLVRVVLEEYRDVL